MINIIFLVITTGFISCCNDPIGPIDPPPVTKEVFELQLAERIEENYEVGSLADGQIYEEWFLVPGDLNDPFTIYAFNIETGKKDWVFSNDGLIQENINISKLIGSTYLGITGNGIVAINLETQQRIWEVDFTILDYYPNNGSIIHDGHLYHNFSIAGVGLDSEAAAIGRFDITDGSYEEIYRATNDNEGLKTNSPPIIYTNNDGHDIMFFNERPNDGPPQEVIQEIVAYDITDNIELWRTKNFTDFYASNSLHPPIIYNNLVITGGDWSMYAFDINTGEQKWKTSVPGYDKFAIWRKTNHLIKNDRLYVNPNGLEIMCLNPQDGSVIWQNLEDAPNCSDNMVYYEKEDYLVFTSWGLGSVMVLDAFTGEKIHREHRFDDSPYNNDVVYDPDTDMFFTSTYKHAIGFKINAQE